MRIRFYRDGRGSACVETDVEYDDLKDFLGGEIGQRECGDLLEQVQAVAGGGRFGDTWNVHSFEISGEGARIENDVLPGNPSSLKLDEFRWVLAEWSDFLAGRSNPGWRFSP